MVEETVIAENTEEVEEKVEAKKCDNIQVEIEQYDKEDILPDGSLKPEAEFKYSVKNYMEAVVKQKENLERDIKAQEYIIEVLEKVKSESGYSVEIERDLASRRKILQDAKIAVQTMEDRKEIYESGIMTEVLAIYPTLVKLNTLLNNPLNLVEYQERLIQIKENLQNS